MSELPEERVEILGSAGAVLPLASFWIDPPLRALRIPPQLGKLRYGTRNGALYVFLNYSVVHGLHLLVNVWPSAPETRYVIRMFSVENEPLLQLLHHRSGAWLPRA